MKAVICKEFAPRAELRIEEVSDPVAKPGQVVIRIEACGINFFDGLMVEGKYQTKPDLPFTPGSEAAGTIISVGEGVERLTAGIA